MPSLPWQSRKSKIYDVEKEDDYELEKDLARKESKLAKGQKKVY